MSARGSYEPPVFRIYEHVAAGAERRSTHPVKQLGRALNQLCLEAADPYEIAAHLEALGYNAPGALSKYGVADHFELARELFYGTPRRLRLDRPTAEVKRNTSRQTVMALTLLVSVAIGLFTVVSAWVAVIWLLVWSQFGGALLNRAKGELLAPRQGEVLTLLLELGVLGLGGAWLLQPFGPATWSVSLLWLGVAALLWAEKAREALVLSATAGAALLPVVALGLPRAALLVAVAAAFVWLLRPLYVTVTKATRVWAFGQGRHVAPFVVYGLGQGAVLFALLYGSGREALPGLALFALLLLSAEPLLLWLRGRLNLHLWKGESAAPYTLAAWRLIARYTAFYLLAFVPALVVWAFPGLGGGHWLFHLVGFALFGLLLGLSLVLLSLGESILPAGIFALGGALLLLGLPFFWVASVLAVAEFALLLRHSALLGRYGVYLL